MFLCYAFISLLIIAENHTQRRKNTKMNKKTCMQMNKNWQKDFFSKNSIFVKLPFFLISTKGRARTCYGYKVRSTYTISVECVVHVYVLLQHQILQKNKTRPINFSIKTVVLIFRPLSRTHIHKSALLGFTN